MDRRQIVIDELIAQASDLSGFDETELAPDVPFLQLGFDSLFLTQAAAAFQKRYGVKVTFRQLMTETPTFTSLADALVPHLPEPAPTVKAETNVPQAAASADPITSPVLAAPNGGEAAVGDEGLAAVFSEQLRLMREQLAVLGAHSSQPTVQNEVAVAPPPTPKSSSPIGTPIDMPKGFGPGQGGDTDELTDDQIDHIARLTFRYNRKTAGSKAQTQADRSVHADPRTAAGFNVLWKDLVYPLVVTRSEGARLWDIDGNEYVDLLNGFGPNFFGHRAPFILEALKEQLDAGFEVGPQTPRAGDAARLLCELTGMDRVSWVNTGSEAVQAAIRIARTMTGRDKIVVFNGDYHGNFDEVLVRGVNSSTQPKTRPMAPGIPMDSVSNVVVLDYGTDAALEYIKAHADDIAAVLVEPVQSRRPEFQPREFLHTLRSITSEQEIVLVFDEVITGFRTEPGGAQAFYGVEADIATYGKIIGGGMPIGVVAGRSRFMDTFDGGHWEYGDDSQPTAGVTFFAGTFVRHPLAIAAAHASLSYLKAAGPGLQAGINAKAARLASTLNAFFEERSVGIFVAQFCSQLFFRVTTDEPLATLFFYHLRDRGIHILEGFPSYLTAAHTDADIDFVIDQVKGSIEEMQADGLIARPVSFDQSVITHELPLTPAQQEVWATCQMGDDASSAYNESDSFVFPPDTDVERLQRAVETSLAAQDAFRTIFSGDGMVQRTLSSGDIACQIHDFRDASPEMGQASLATLLERESQTPFCLHDGPLVRAHLVCLSGGEIIFSLYAHHIIYDGYSADVIIRSVCNVYSGGDAKSVSYHRFLAKAGDQAAQQRSLGFWTDRLSETSTSPLALPSDRPFPARRQFDGATLTAELGPAEAEALDILARQCSVTPAAVIASAYSVLMMKLCGRDDVVIGVPLAGQATTGVDCVGYAVNMMPIPAAIAGSFADLATRIQLTLADGAEHVAPSMIDLIDAIGVDRDPARPSLIQAVVNFSRFMDDLDLDGKPVSFFENQRRSVVYDLFLNVRQAEGKLLIDWDYSSVVFDETTIARWVEHFAHLLKSLASSVDQPLSHVQLFDPDTVNWGRQIGAKASLKENQTTLDVIQSVARSSGGQIAVQQGEVKLTYTDLWHSAERVGKHLVDQGVKPGDRVGIFMARTPNLLPALLGVWRAGAAYVPFDPSYPAPRLSMIAEDADLRCILTDESYADQASSFGVPAVLFAAEARAVELPPMPTADGPAYLLYTSGSTGKPKGVENAHGGLFNFLSGLAELEKVNDIQSCLAVTTLGFDISMIELFYPLTIGAKVILGGDDVVGDGEAITALVTETAPMMMQATPSLYQVMLASGWQADKAMVLLSGGEPLTGTLAEQLIPRSQSLWNFYGPTEASVYCSCTEITDPTNISIGKPMPGVSLYVVDANGDLCAPGVLGELWISGSGVCTGYRNRPELNAERFVKDPLCPDSPRRAYRTGDVAYMRADGRIELLGRSDNQVKVRGHRIELGEIEAALTGHREVEQAAVVVHTDDHEEKTLVAYVDHGDNEGVTGSALRKYLRKQLPPYMVPQRFVEIEAMPLNSAGKLDRGKLPSPDGFAVSEVTVIPPRDAIEEALAAIWKDMLSVEKISVTDNFFDLGGQSLQAAQMVAKVKTGLGRKIAARSVIFDTLEQLAASSEAV